MDAFARWQAKKNLHSMHNCCSKFDLVAACQVMQQLLAQLDQIFTSLDFYQQKKQLNGLYNKIAINHIGNVLLGATLMSQFHEGEKVINDSVKITRPHTCLCRMTK